MNIQTLKGFRDFLPKEVRKRQYVLDILKNVFESYGFEPLETPALEYEEVLAGKYGDEGEKLMYRFKDLGGRSVAMRYDQTVPLARVMAQYQNDLPLPFKRYQIQNVWRAENTQKGRYREFLQVDIDTVGSTSLLSEAEIIAVLSKALKKLGFKSFKIRVNWKSTVEKLSADLEYTRQPDRIIREMDKRGKIPPLQIGETMFKSGATITASAVLSGTVSSMSEYQSIQPTVAQSLEKWITNNPDNPKAKVYAATSLEDILKDEEEEAKKYFDTYKRKPNLFNDLWKILVKYGVSNVQYDASLVRGLEYYTGIIFEVEVDGYNAGSIAGGGRYDNLIGMFAGKQVPAVGFSFGFDRLIEAMDELNLFEGKDLGGTKVLITNIGEKSFEVADKLREEGIDAELYVDEKDLDKQLKYADKRKIPFVLIFDNSKLILKNMASGEQKEITLRTLPDAIR